MSTTNLTINLDSELKDKAQYAFDEIGIDISKAINALLYKAVYQKEIPLETLAESPVLFVRKDRNNAFGCLKGKICVPNDFNEPLDDFEEYM